MQYFNMALIKSLPVAACSQKYFTELAKNKIYIRFSHIREKRKEGEHRGRAQDKVKLILVFKALAPLIWRLLNFNYSPVNGHVI